MEYIKFVATDPTLTDEAKTRLENEIKVVEDKIEDLERDLAISKSLIIDWMNGAGGALGNSRIFLGGKW